VVYLRRDIESIRAALGPGVRPMLKDEDSLRNLYDQRHEMYEGTCDILIDNEGSIESVAQKALDELTAYFRKKARDCPQNKKD